jgi:hypothetical protein
MRDATLKPVLGAVLAGAAILLGQIWLGQIWLGSSAQDRQAASAGLFMEFLPVLQHPRCLNCHIAVDFPRQGEARRPHIMQVKRGPEGSGAPGLQCGTCHQRSNSPAGVPGANNWHLAPLRMAWEGLNAGQICRALLDPAKSGMNGEQLIRHLDTDHLVLWAWQGGVDLNGAPRQAPPLSHAAFTELVGRWLASGAHCPG